MLNFLVIVFIISLVYFSKIEMIRSYIQILILQGVLLFFIALLELKSIDTTHLVFILVETLLFKSVFVPVFLHRVAKDVENHRNDQVLLKSFHSLLIGTGIIVGSFAIAHWLHDEHLQVKYFTAAIASMIIGLYIAINHKDIITHIICYLVIENGIFMLSLALGSEMPMLVNSAILLDIFGSLLIMGIFFDRIRGLYNNPDVEDLTELKD